MKKAKPITLVLAAAMLLGGCAQSADTLAATTAEATQEATTTAAAETTTQTEARFMDTQYRLPAYYDALPSLKEALKDNFKIGTAINAYEYQQPADSDEVIAIKKHFNVFTPENELKPISIAPEEGVFEFEVADQYVDFANSVEDSITRGHTLVWHSQVPMWWFQGSGENGAATRDELLARMKEHISTVVGRYKGRIDVWDVVNECISDSTGDIRRMQDMSFWADIIGDMDGDGKDTDYIEQAFVFAHEADPDAELILNDYSLEQDPKKLQAFYDLAKSMIEKGIPIDGVGIQAHIQMRWPSIEMFEACIEKLASLKELDPDFKVQITELDVSIFDWNDQSLSKEMTPELEKELAVKYADLFDMFRRQQEKGNLELVVLWGVHDGMSWLNGYPIQGRTNAPLLFDRELLAKPAFWGVVDRSQIDAAVAEQVPAAN
jgi:endo-1,4-beta-xylanase